MKVGHITYIFIFNGTFLASKIVLRLSISFKCPGFELWLNVQFLTDSLKIKFFLTIFCYH